MAGFIGRTDQIAALNKILKQVTADKSEKPGRAILMRGRRRVGKSRLVEEFLNRAGVPGVFFAASKQSKEEELKLFTQAVLESNMPGKEVFGGVTFETWEAAFRMLVRILPARGSSIIVIDELPYLMQDDRSFEGTLQKIFDREISLHKVLLIGIGSDLAMMEALNEHDRPFYQRATEMVIPPLTPAEVSEMLQVNAADAFDAYLITGGLPLICKEWARGNSMWEYLKEALSSAHSALIVSGERSLAAEFSPNVQAREILSAVGSGERTFTNIGRAAGVSAQTSIQRSLEILTNKRIVIGELPLSTTKSKETRYRIVDPYLRFWLRFIGPNMAELERGKGDRVLQKIETAWPAWRGRAIEPIVRESIERIPNPFISSPIPFVGSFWTRTNNPEIDIVIGDRSPVAQTIYEVGSIKWKESSTFGTPDLDELLDHRSQLPGADASTPLVVVSRSGFSLPKMTKLRMLGPDELLAAWR